MTSIDILPKKKKNYIVRTNTSETNEFYVLFSKLVVDKKNILKLPYLFSIEFLRNYLTSASQHHLTCIYLDVFLISGPVKKNHDGTA